MGVLSRLANWYVARSNSQNPSQWFIDWIRGGQVSSSGVAVSQLRAMRDVTWMAGISIRSSDLAKCPLHVYRKTPDGGQEIFSGHAVERLLQQPNFWQNKLEFVELMQATFLNKGNAVAAIQKNGRNQPVGLIPIECWEVRTYETGELYYYWTANNIHQEAVLRGFPNPISADEILHLRWLGFDGLCGLSRLGLARDAIGLSIALEEYSAKLFSNGTRLSGHYETDKKLSDPVFNRLKQQLTEYAGLENSGKAPILEEGLKFAEHAMTSVESQTIEARRLQIEQIATALDIPQHRLGIKSEGGSQEIIASHQMYLNNTISTDAERWESKLNQIFGFDGINTFVEFDLDYFNRADLKTRNEAYRIGIAGSLYKVDEARNKEGLGRVPHGNVVLQPANVVPLGTVPTNPSSPGPGSDTTGEPAPGGDGDPAALKPVD